YGTLSLEGAAYILVLLLGYAGAAAASVTGLARIGRRDLSLSLLTLPAYWIMGGLAALSAVLGLIRDPHYWAKTDHAGRAQPHHARARYADPARRGREPADLSAPGE